MRPIGGCLSAAASSSRRPLGRRLASAPSSCLSPSSHPPAAAAAIHARLVSSQSNDATAPHRNIAKLLAWTPESDAHGVVVNGYVRSVRTMKSASFVSLGDGSSLNALQAVVPADQANGISVGAAVRFVGSWVKSRGTGQSHELQVDHVNVVGPSDGKSFPIQKKYQTPEYLRTLPHLRTRTPFNAVLLRLRSEVIQAMSQFFASRDFVQTHPPIITSSDCEGAGEVFTLHPPADPDSRGANQAVEAAAAGASAAPPFFGSPKYLTVSAQLHLEALAQSIGNVWALSPTFRAERSDTSRHLSEFYMLEAEMAFVDRIDAVMDLVEDMLRSVSRGLRGSRVFEDLLQARSSKFGSPDSSATAEDIDRRWRGLTSEAWPRITYTEAVHVLREEALRSPDRFEFAPVWGHGLQAEHEKFIAEAIGEGRPVFVTHYPRDIKAFYMPTSPPCPDISASMSRSETSAPGSTDERVTVDCFDLLVPELCEIAGGSMREHRLQPLLDTMKSRGMVGRAADAGVNLDHSGGIGGGSKISDGDPNTGTGTAATESGVLDWYVNLRRWGCPPHGGFGIGFDRLLCYMSGVQSIRDVVAFPRWYGRCDC